MAETIGQRLIGAREFVLDGRIAGLTLGELGSWFVKTLKLDVEYRVIEMEGWSADAGPGFGWPLGERTWVNPSPNAAPTVRTQWDSSSTPCGTSRP